MSSDPAANAAVLAGIVGKIPALADYVERGVPHWFAHPWSAWLDRVMGEGAAAFGARWKRLFAVSPPWGFAVPAGVLGPVACVGLMLPSSDRIGRAFPLTLIVGPVGPDVLAAEISVDRIEAVALELIDGEIEPAAALARLDPRGLGGSPPAASGGPTLAWNGAGGSAVARIGAQAAADDPDRVRFWHRAWGDRAAIGLASEGLPPPAAIAALIGADPAAEDWTVLAGDAS